MIGKIVLIVSVLAVARAQIPSFGSCPGYVPMVEFNLKKFLGVWYEAERYFQFTEVVSKCVMANYTYGSDGNFHVSNEVTNRFTGIKRVFDGVVKQGLTKDDAGKLFVKYAIPLTPEVKYSVLETDYISYAVLWSCSGLGLVNTQNAWVMTRRRSAPSAALQQAYAVLDRYKISKTFFLKTNQNECEYTSTTTEAPSAGSPAQETTKPNSENVRSDVIVEEPDEVAEEETEEEKTVANDVVILPQRIMELAEAMKGDSPTEEKQLTEAVNEKNV